jgi:hypothetical protein
MDAAAVALEDGLPGIARGFLAKINPEDVDGAPARLRERLAGLCRDSRAALGAGRGAHA